MLVISDSSPIRALSTLGQLGLLRTLFGEVLIPPAVARELGVSVPALPAFSLAQQPFILVRPPTSSIEVDRLRQRLGLGESEALALAVEMRADAILIDEARGRRAAVSLGLHPIGVLGVLLQAKRRGLVPRLGPLLDQLQMTIAFRLSPDLRAEALRLAGE